MILALTMIIAALIIYIGYTRFEMRSLQEENHSLMSKSEHLTMASHEVKNLALEISNYADDIKKGFVVPPLSEEPLRSDSVVTLVEADVTSMFVAAKTLGNFVYEFLEVNRMKNVDALPIIASRLNVTNAIKDAIRIYKHSVSNKGIALKVTPRVVNPQLFIVTDTIRFKQILLNLIGNAVKYTDEGYIEIDAYIDGGYLTVRVTDTGIGIPQKQINRALSGHRATNAAGRDGHGIGLTTVNRLVRDLAGALMVESVEDKGTTVTFSIRDNACNEE